MSNAIEVLKVMRNNFNATSSIERSVYLAKQVIALDEAILALEQKDYLLRELNEIKKLVRDLNDFREELHIDGYEDLELIEHIESIEKVIERAKKEIHKQRIKELESGVER